MDLHTISDVGMGAVGPKQVDDAVALQDFENEDDGDGPCNDTIPLFSARGSQTNLVT